MSRPTVSYDAEGRSVVIPDVNAGVVAGDEYVPLRGNGYVMAVRRDGRCVGYIDCNQLGYRTVREYMDACEVRS